MNKICKKNQLLDFSAIKVFISIVAILFSTTVLNAFAIAPRSEIIIKPSSLTKIITELKMPTLVSTNGFYDLQSICNLGAKQAERSKNNQTTHSKSEVICPFPKKIEDSTNSQNAKGS